MRKLIAAIMVAGAALVAAPALAADFPDYPPIIDIPDVDYGVAGSFYLRGSAAGNGLWGKDGKGYDCFGCGGAFTLAVDPITAWGYGYSVGAGFGYETGTGLRVDATVDYVHNSGLTVSKAGGAFPGDYKGTLRSTIALANVYYDFAFGQSYGYGAAGGAFGYVGAGAGMAFNNLAVQGPVGTTMPDGNNSSLAAAGMVGVGYDFGAVVADVGYRAVYINQINNSAAGTSAAWVDNAWLHEVRGTLRYRFN
ncbi:hypothetical protein [Devosia sp. A449]